VHSWSRALRAGAVASTLAIAVAGCEAARTPASPTRDSRPAAAAAAAPSLHGAAVLSGTYRLPGPGPQVVTLPLEKAAPAGDAVLAATAAGPGGPWGYAPVTVASSGRTVTLTATGGSLVTVLGLAAAPLRQDFTSFFAGMVQGAGGRTPANPPSCPDQQAAQSGYQAQATGTAGISWCLGMRSGRPVLMMVNGLDYPMEISHLGMPITEAASADSFQVSALSGSLSGSDSILEPGQQIGYGIIATAGAVDQAATQYDGLAEGLYEVQNGLHALLIILTMIDPGVGGGSELPGLMNAAVRTPGCADALLDRNPVAVTTGCLAPDVVVRIFQAAGLGTTGWLVIPAVAGGGTGAFLDREFQQIHTALASQDNISIVVGQHAACPDAARVLAAWNASPASARLTWTSPDVAISSFEDISCWGGWVVAAPVAEGNGTFVFSQVGGLHVLPVPDLPEFDKAVCSTSESPSDWKSAAAGPADCNP
jgi:hypothetical protein